MNVRPTAALLLALSLLGCGAQRTAAPADPLATLRRAAQRAPDDLTARRDRALAELVAPGGDLTFAESELTALSARLPHDPRVRFAEGLLAAQHGDFERAVAALTAAVEAARRTPDALGPAIAESAVSKLVSMRGDVRDFAAHFGPLAEAVRADPGHLGAGAAFEVLETAVRWARERGDRALQDNLTAAAGCVQSFTVAGPFGPLPALRFDETLPPEDTGPLAARYDLGPGRPALRPYVVQSRGCAANLGRGSTLTGVLFATSDFALNADRDVVVRVESPNAFTVLLDGVRIATLDPRRRAAGATVTVPVHLAAGRHSLRVKVASLYHSPLVMAAVLDTGGRPVARFLPPEGAAHTVPPALREPAAVDAPSHPVQDAYAPVDALDPFARYVFAELAFSRRHPVAARELLRPLATAATPTATTLVAWASVAQADPFLPPGQARDRARRAYERAGQLDGRAYFPALQLARLTAEDERGDEALQMLRTVQTRFADNPEVESELADRLLQRNWEGEAVGILSRARERLPGACWPVRMLYTVAQRHGDGTREAGLAEDIRRCDALSDTAVNVYTRMRRYADAARELDRLLVDDPEGRGLRRSLMELARARGDIEESVRRGAALLEAMPEDDTLRADLADLLVATGQRDRARAMLDRELSRNPAELSGLFRLRSLLAGVEDLDPWRLDGRAVLRDFDASGRRYDAAAVLVLDYTVRRNLPDGSALELTHNLVRVQSREGVEAYGEFSLPANATLLAIRTLKPDGRALEPEEIAGKDTLSLPDLAPGDTVEFEYVRTLSATEVAPGGFLTDRFYFRGFDVPYDRTEYVLVSPRAMAPLVDARGPAPTATVTERGGLVEHRWMLRHSERMTPEPSSVATREFVPSVAAGHGATWGRFVDALRARLLDLDVPDPEALALVRQLTARARTADARLAALHGWVIANIQQEGGGTPFESAPRMLAARAGHRTRVLCYLAKLADIPCDIALVRQGSSDATPSDLADDDTFQSILLRVRTESGERWVTAADNNAPLDFIPPASAGGEALVLTEGAPRARVPALNLDAHGRVLTVRLALEPDGSGRAEVEERLRGFAATGARQVLRRLDAANLERQFEGYVGGMVAGASLVSVRVEGATRVEDDVVFHYTFTAPGLATRSAGRLVFDGMFHAEAARTWAELPTRSTPLWNGDPVNATLDLTVTLPAGAALDDLPPAAEGAGPGVSWSIAWERQGDGRGFRLRRRVRLPTGRVAVADYPAFAESVRALDAADTRRAIIRVP